MLHTTLSQVETTQVLEEVIECKISNINLQHTDPVQIDIEITLPMKDEKLITLHECDPCIKQLRKQWTENSLDQNIYTMENNILKWKFIENGLLYTPIVVLDILKDCLLILAHDKSGHNGFRKTYGSPIPPKAEICLEKLAVNALVKFTKWTVNAPHSIIKCSIQQKFTLSYLFV